MIKESKSACPLNCYDVCGFKVYTENNRIIKIEGDSAHPITKGKICGKGKLIKERIYDRERLLYPQKKMGNRFVRISWEQAIREISKKMTITKEIFGSTAVLHSYDYSNGGLLKGLDRRFFNFFGGMTEVNGSLCWGAGIQAQIYDTGDALSHSVIDIKNAKTIVIWGRNITTTNIHLSSFLLNAKKNGGELVVIDPIKTNIAKKANRYININPGMDGLLALAICKVLIDNDWHDKNFILQHSIGFEHFYKEIEDLDIEKISKEVGIYVKDINELAKIYSKGPVMTFLGLGMQRYGNGGNSIRAIDALGAISGNIGKKGGGVQFANLAVGKSFNWSELLRDDIRTDYRTFSRSTQADEIISEKNPPIKMMFISRSNPVIQLPNIKRTIDALRQVETKVVIDLFMTDTAKLADYILPTTSVFEEEDIYYGSMFHNIIRYGPKLINPLGETRSDLEIWSALANELNLKGFEKTVEEYFDIALKPLNKYGLNLKILKEEGQFLLPLRDLPWEDKQFYTPSGKYEFYSESAKQDGLSPTVILSYPRESIQEQEKLKEKYPYNLLTIHPKKSLHSQHIFLLNKKNHKPRVILSLEIANKMNIKNGEKVKVYNDRGQIVGIAIVNQGINKKTIVVEEGWWKDSGYSANFLTSNKNSDMGNGSILYDCAVMIEKINK